VLIAIDTSTAWCGVALYDPAAGALLEERIWRTGADHARQLLPEIDAAVRAQGLRARDLTGVGVALGPGTFNGVRVAVSTAKLLGQALGLPVVGVETLELYAQAWRGSGLLVRPILGAARGEVGTALWRAGDQLERLEPTRLAAPDELLVPPDQPTLFVGELEESWRARVGQLGRLARLAGPDQTVRRPGALAALAVERLARGQADRLEALEPIYLRPPHITRPRR
jgi:tRNA threonylcarbamoyladenosine biosynthesis protein TsaB